MTRACRCCASASAQRLRPTRTPELYDIALIEAVTAFQAENGLTADGILGPRTLLALNGPTRENDIAAIVVNMERWRWMPRDFGAFHVMVNVPEFMVRVVSDGEDDPRDARRGRRTESPDADLLARHEPPRRQSLLERARSRS